MTLVAYLGGAGTDDCDGIATDRAGDIYLACHSDSPDFPLARAKAGSRSQDAMDAVVVKIEPRTGRLVWATRTGGSAWDAVGDISVTVLFMRSARHAPPTSPQLPMPCNGASEDRTATASSQA